MAYMLTRKGVRCTSKYSAEVFDLQNPEGSVMKQLWASPFACKLSSHRYLNDDVYSLYIHVVLQVKLFASTYM